MPLETVRVTAVLPVSADRVYAAWLDSAEHSQMTGAPATVDPTIGGEHSAWDGYVHGKTLELEPARRIVQSWRSTDFPLGHADSRVEVHLLDLEDGGCEIAILHGEIPEGQGAQYEEGWREHYLDPMRKYFAKSAKAKPAARGKPAARTAAKRSAKQGARAKKGPKKTARKAAKKVAATKKPAKRAKSKGRKK